MAEYRLTTLNLDDECRQILGEQDNQSRYARECIKRYAEVVEDLDRIENRHIRMNAGMNRLASKLAEGAMRNATVQEVLADFLHMTEIEFVRLVHDVGYFEQAFKAETLHPSMS